MNARRGNIYFNQTLIMQSVEAIKTPPPLQPRRRALATWGLRENQGHRRDACPDR
jgi:hypothetical protein